jgi:AAA domain-containing protein
VRLYDLLDHATYLALGQRPQRIGEELAAGDRLVVIDEIQRLPELLNEVLIEARGTKFLLTGSSARKLRRGSVNLLGGRARIKYLHPPPRSGKIYRWPRTPEKKFPAGRRKKLQSGIRPLWVARPVTPPGASPSPHARSDTALAPSAALPLGHDSGSARLQLPLRAGHAGRRFAGAVARALHWARRDSTGRLGITAAQ